MVDIIPLDKGILIRDGEKKYFIAPPFFSFWNFRNLIKRSLIIGYVGARGSGKSVAAARTIAVDSMLRGKKVWSNMNIEFNLIKNGRIIKMKSERLDRLSVMDLDSVFRDGLIYLDEVNLMMEARRAMSEENLMVSYILQQLRKRKLNIMWSAQSEMHCDDRLRFQTDIFVTCQDMSIVRTNVGIGELSLWKCHDFSGVVKGRTPNKSEDSVFFEGIIWNKPWWNIFDTEQIQDVDIPEEDKVDDLEESAITYSEEIANYINKKGSIDKDAVWLKWGIFNLRLRKKIGVKLSTEYGIVKRSNKYKLLEVSGVE